MRVNSFAIVLSLMLLSACSHKKSEHPAFDHCKTDTECGFGVCREGFCVLPGSGTGVDDAGKEGMPCADASVEGELCDERPTVGVCRAGRQFCVNGTYGPCQGAVAPGDHEVIGCNDVDEDCDGRTDEFPECITRMQGACGIGQITCYQGAPFCDPTTVPSEELCNSVDDDCDGETDEISAAPCFPEGMMGCVATPEGMLDCDGLCAPGVFSCKNGVLECEGATLPLDEQCTESGEVAVDEDCDTKFDEDSGCLCVVATLCYSGPDGTQDHEPCKAGTLGCVGGQITGCNGQIVPAPETCGNGEVDNDCNGTDDDIPGEGDPCYDDEALGICRFGAMTCTEDSDDPVCMTPQAGQMDELCDEIDQDCDGNPINGFDLQSDRNNCGECRNECGDRETCCQGKCTPQLAVGPLPPVPNECACATECTEEQYCCGSECVDLQTDPQNCGACSVDCTNGGNTDTKCIEGHCPGVVGPG